MANATLAALLAIGTMQLASGRPRSRGPTLAEKRAAESKRQARKRERAARRKSRKR